jgi:histidine triad (HIT) family protein
MEKCLFCSIVAGATPAHLVHEDASAVAFLDVFPVARPHVLVIPRAHAPTLLDLDDQAVGGLFRTVKAVQQKVQSAFQPLGFNVGWNHGRAAGQHVFHLHVHVIPRYEDDPLQLPGKPQEVEQDELAKVAGELGG